MSALEIYLKAVVGKRGLEHAIAIQNLRQYIRVSDEETIAEFIVRINDINLLKYLWEVGLTSRLQRAAMARYNTLKAEQGGE